MITWRRTGLSSATTVKLEYRRDMPALVLPRTVAKHPLKAVYTGVSLVQLWIKVLIRHCFYIVFFFADLNARIPLSLLTHPHRLSGSLSLSLKQHNRLFPKEGRQGVIWLKLQLTNLRHPVLKWNFIYMPSTRF